MSSSKIIAAVIAVLAFGWIASGFLLPKADAPTATKADTPQASAEQVIQVRVRELEAQDFSDDVIVTGRTQASRAVDLRAETSGQIEELLKQEGMPVAEGDILAKIEIRDRSAKLREAKERVNQRQIEFNAAKSLEGKGFNSKVRLAQARADLENARAELKEAEIELANTVIKSPFDGVVYEQEIEQGDFVDVSNKLFSVVDLNPIELVGFVSERHVEAIRPGSTAAAEFLNGQILEGTVSYIAPAANPDTRTFRVEISAPNEDAVIKEGLTAKLRIPVQSKKAHKISPSVLSLNDEGRVGVKIVNAQDKTEFVPITILSDREDSMWIHGLPDKVRLITVGQDFVGENQKVNPVKADGDGSL